MKTRCRWFTILVVLLLSPPLAMPAGMAQIGGAVSEVRLATVGKHALLQIAVSIPAPGSGSDPTGLAGFQFTLRFDPTVVHLEDPNESFTSAGIPAFAPLGGNPFCATVRQTAACDDPNWFLTAGGRTV